MKIYTAAIKKCDPRQGILQVIHSSAPLQVCGSGTTHYGRALAPFGKVGTLSREELNHLGRHCAVLHISTDIGLVGAGKLPEKEAAVHLSDEFPPLHHAVFPLESQLF